MYVYQTIEQPCYL